MVGEEQVAGVVVGEESARKSAPSEEVVGALAAGGGGGLETEARAPPPHAHAADQQEAGRGRPRRKCLRAALLLCLLPLPACVLVVGNLRAESSPRMLFDVDDLPKYDDDDQGTTRTPPLRIHTRP